MLEIFVGDGKNDLLTESKREDSVSEYPVLTHPR
jgi:hypothetical protein